MTPTTLHQARAVRQRLANQTRIAWHIAGHVALAAYLSGRGVQAQRTAAIITHDRCLRILQC